jgi:hypothetical protein
MLLTRPRHGTSSIELGTKSISRGLLHHDSRWVVGIGRTRWHCGLAHVHPLGARSDKRRSRTHADDGRHTSRERARASDSAVGSYRRSAFLPDRSPTRCAVAELLRCRLGRARSTAPVAPAPSRTRRRTGRAEQQANTPQARGSRRTLGVDPAADGVASRARRDRKARRSEVRSAPSPQYAIPVTVISARSASDPHDSASLGPARMCDAATGRVPA